MARLARIVVPGVPHHIAQRGNRRQETFFSDSDYKAYLRLLSEWCACFRVAVRAYCLMPNHVHLIAVPQTADGLARAIGETHRRYARRINSREGWRGHLWQGRFSSFPMDAAHLLAAALYVELNPVRAGLRESPGDWPWSSAKAHLAGRNDGVVRVKPLLEMVPDWRGFLEAGLAVDMAETLRRHARTGRPLGGEGFMSWLEAKLGRALRPGKPGRKVGGGAA